MGQVKGDGLQNKKSNSTSKMGKKYAPAVSLVKIKLPEQDSNSVLQIALRGRSQKGVTVTPSHEAFSDPNMGTTVGDQRQMESLLLHHQLSDRFSQTLQRQLKHGE